MEVCNVFLNDLNTFCKEFYTCMCNITKKLSSLVKNMFNATLIKVTGRLAQLVERRTREHNVSGLYRCGFESLASQLKLLIVFQMRL